MSTTINHSLTLRQPLTAKGLPKPKRSAEFRRQLLLSPIVFGASVAAAFLWELMGLPKFGPEGNEHAWIFPLYILGVFFSVQNVFSAFREEYPRRMAQWSQERQEAFEFEVFPFLEAELEAVDRHYTYSIPLDLPPRDWTVELMLEDLEHGAGFGARHEGSDEFSHFKFTLENGGREVRFRAVIPEGVEEKGSTLSIDKG